MRTCITRSSNRIPQTSRVPSSPPYYTVTYDSMGYTIFYTNFEIDLHLPLKIFFYFIPKIYLNFYI
jgi:hypothetical protein